MIDTDDGYPRGLSQTLLVLVAGSCIAGGVWGAVLSFAFFFPTNGIEGAVGAALYGIPIGLVLGALIGLGGAIGGYIAVHTTTARPIGWATWGACIGMILAWAVFFVATSAGTGTAPDVATLIVAVFSVSVAGVALAARLRFLLSKEDSDHPFDASAGQHPVQRV